MSACCTSTVFLVMEYQPDSRYLQTPSSSSGLSRRYACDRCRGHKLRCHRDSSAPNNSPCQRCSKAKTSCIVSSTHRRGKTVEKAHDPPVENSEFLTSGQNGCRVGTSIRYSENNRKSSSSATILKRNLD
jgi:hypothetical protein